MVAALAAVEEGTAQQRRRCRPSRRFASISADALCPHPVKGRRPAGQRRPGGQQVLWELGEAEAQLRLTPSYLATHRPGALLALAPRAAVLFAAGALSGALAKTLTAPLDRVKILLQVKGGLETGAVAAAAQQGNLVKAFLAIGKQEGVRGYWKGNLPQARRPLASRAAPAPHAARSLARPAQLSVAVAAAAGAARGAVQRCPALQLRGVQARLPGRVRRAHGAAAHAGGRLRGHVSHAGARWRGGTLARTSARPLLLWPGGRAAAPRPPLSPTHPCPTPAAQLTYPLDTLRLRLAVDPNLKGLGGAVRVLLREGGSASFYRGLGASMLGALGVPRAACRLPAARAAVLRAWAHVPLQAPLPMCYPPPPAPHPRRHRALHGPGALHL